MPLIQLKSKIETLLVPSCNDKIEIKNILMLDVRGKTITDSYRQNKVLTDESQNLLMDVILDHIFNGANLSIVPTPDIEKLADEICLIFPNETKVQNN